MSSDVAEGIRSSARGGEGFFKYLGEGSVEWWRWTVEGRGRNRGVYGVEQPMTGGSHAREDPSHCPRKTHGARCVGSNPAIAIF